MDERKYSSRTLEYKLVVVLEDVLGKIRYINIPSAPIDYKNIEVPHDFHTYDENDLSVVYVNEFEPSFFIEYLDESIEGFLDMFFTNKLNEIWAVPIKEIKAMYYEFVYTVPFVFGTNTVDESLHNTLIDGTSAKFNKLPLVAL